MELTLEDKARVFGLYLGANILMPKSGRKAVLLGVNTVPFELNDGEDWRLYEYFPFQLILKPLSEISDEDAIEVANLYGVTIETRYATHDNIISYGRERARMEWERNLALIDFLRSRGYAIPYKGTDLFEAGIAIKP